MDLPDLEALNRKRRAIRPLLSTSDPGDALASYYALWHDPRRTELTLHYDARKQVDGFLVIAQTGADLFRPLVTLRAQDDTVAADLLQSALVPNRPYRVVVPQNRASVARDGLEIANPTLYFNYMLDPSRFQPVVNVLVQSVTSADGALRFQIESQDQVVAMSGTNWRSPSFAEVFVYVHPRGRGRGWGKSVVSACTAALLDERIRPLYLLQKDNAASVRIADSLGYIDTGHREFSAECQLK